MRIKRLQVKEGFLDGIDLTFGDGLNVLIGARGTGKTSIIELMRFCLGVPNFISKSETLSREHALAVLGSGEVSVTLEVDGREIIVTRTESDDVPRPTEPFEKPIVFSQTEIEHVGLEAASRLRIIDRFRPKLKNEARKNLIASEIRSLTVQLRSIREEIDRILENITTLTPFSAELLEARGQQEEMLKSLHNSSKRQEELVGIDKELSILSVRTNLYSDALRELDAFSIRVTSTLARGPNIESWPVAAGDKDLLAPVRKVTFALEAISEEVGKLLSEYTGIVNRLREENAASRVRVETKARGLRQELEGIVEGAGKVTRRVTELEEKVGQLNALRSSRESQTEFAKNVQSRRSALLAEWEELSEERFESRVAVAKKLNDTLGPSLEIKVERSGEFSNYISAVSAALRGSGLHYNQIAPSIAAKMSPREFAEAVEENNYAFISEVGGLTLDRAEKVCAEIRATGTEEIICAELDDVARMYLLDSTEYKSTENLSVGQRCTVVLPIILEFTDVPLIVDQPEDHLDNAFIVDTLIEAIKQRKNSGQLIFSTHNANIPVLGEADTVIHMDSDGRRGFVRNAGDLESLSTVESITSVMEGGIDAFRRRGIFYDERFPFKDD